MKPNKLYHCTTPRKAKLYRQTGYIISPVRGFENLQGAMAWCIKTGRAVILELEGWEQDDIHKLPDHHNKFSKAFWIDMDVKSWHCVFSVENDA